MEKVDYDVDAQVTLDPAAVVKSIYTVTVNKRIVGSSYTMAAVIPEGITSTVTVSLQTQQSSEPISG